MKKIIQIKKKVFLLLILISSFPFAPSAQFIVTYPATAENLTVCLNSSLLTVRIDLTQPTSNNSVTINLAPGMNYLAGSLTKTGGGGTQTVTIAENGGSENVPTFTLSPASLNAGDYIIFTIARTASCGAYSHAQSGGIFKDIVTVQGAAGTVTENDPTLNTYNIIYPSFSFLQPPAVNNTVVGGVYIRNFTITNGGTGSASAVHFYIVYPSAGIELISLTLGGNTITNTSVNGDTLFFSMTGAQLGGDNLFTNGESLVFTENFKLKKCNTTTLYSAGWGCGESPKAWCQGAGGSGSITMATGVPVLTYQSYSTIQLTNMCNNWIGQYVYKNSGTETVAGAGTAFNINPLFGMNASGAVLTHNALVGTIINFEIVGSGTTYSIPFCTDCDPAGANSSGGSATITLNSDPDGAGGLTDADGDGYFDDLAVGQSFTFRVTIRFDCQASVPSTHSGGGGHTSMDYDNQCGVAQIRSIATHLPSSTNATLSPLSVQGPADINSGDIITISGCFARRESINNSSTSFFNCPSDKLLFGIKKPVGFSYVNGTAKFRNAAATAYTSNDTIYVVGNASNVNLTDYTCFEAQLQLDCNQYIGPAAFNISLTYICDNGCSCKEVWGRVSYTPLVHCPTACPDGGLTTQFISARRITMGYSDNTGLARANPASVPVANLMRALPCDTVLITALGIQMDGTSGGAGHSWDNGYFSIEYDRIGNNLLDYKGGKVMFYQASSGLHYTSDLPAPTISYPTGRHKALYNLTSAFSAYGLLHPGDSLNVYIKAVVLDNATYLDASLKVLPNPVVKHYNFVSSVEYTCASYSLSLYLHRYSISLRGGTGNQTVTGCKQYYAGINTWSPLTITDLYPGEYRTGLYLDSIVVNFDNTHGILDYSSPPVLLTRNENGTQTQVPLGSPTYNTSYGFTWVNPGNWPISDEVTEAGSNVANTYYIPGCQSQNGSPSIAFYGRNNWYAYPVACRPVIMAQSKYPVVYVLPTLTLTDLTGTIQAYLPSHDWTIRMSNPTTVTTPNIWLAIPDKAGIHVTQVTDVSTGTPLTPINYPGGIWYQLSSTGLPSGNNKDYRIEFTYTSCNLNSLKVLAGWDCAGYPPDPSAYPCTPKELNLWFDPQISEVQLLQDAVPATPVDLCAPLQYQYRVNCAQAANTVDNLFKISVPQGINPFTGSFQAEYPAGSNSWQTLTPTISASTYTYDLTTLSTYPTATGLPGTLSGVINEYRQIGVRFSMQTNCGFIAGSSYTLNTTANRPCGQPAIGNDVKLQSPPITVNGITLNYTTINTLTTDPSVGCGETMTVAMTTLIIGGTTGTGGKVYVDLPVGVEYVAASYSCSSAPNCPVYNGNSILPDGRQRVELSIPQGIGAGTTMSYTLSVRFNNYSACGTNEIELQTVDVFGDIPCATEPGGTCPSVSVQTGSVKSSFEILKPTLEITGLQGGILGSHSGTQSYTMGITVQNTGTVTPTAAAVVDFYCADASGNPTGVILSSYTLPGTINPGEVLNATHSFSTTAACTPSYGLVAVLDHLNAANCVCATSRKKSTYLTDPQVVKSSPLSTYTPGTQVSWIIRVSNNQPCDVDGDSSTASVTITIDPVDDIPLAANDLVSTTEDTPLYGDAATNDSPSGDGGNVWTLEGANGGALNGTVVMNPDGTYTYTPDPDFNGIDVFTYEVCDIDGDCSTATVTITIDPVDDVPVAVHDVKTSSEDSPVSGDVATNDLLSGDGGNTFNVACPPCQANLPANGSLVFNADGTFTYTPNANFNGTDFFVYELCDADGDCDTAIVTIMVSPVDDVPLAVSDVNTTDEDNPVSGNVAANDTPSGDGGNIWTLVGTDGGALNGTVIMNPDGTFTYTPSPDFNGTDTFTYQVCDADADCAVATVTITVNPVNDPPLAQGDINNTLVDTPVSGSVTTNDSDPDGDPLTVTITPVTPPANGNLILNPDGSYTYTPDPGFTGTDTFVYEVCDNGTPPLCDQASVTITVLPIPGLSNDPPVANNDAYQGSTDLPVNGSVLPNDYDPDGNPDPLSVTLIGPSPSDGTLTLNPDGTFIFVPNPGFTGTVTFDYQVCDLATPALCDVATVTIDLFTDPDGNSTFAVDDSYVGPEDTPITGNVMDNDYDPEGDEQTVNTSPISLPQHGTLVLNPDGSFVYVPEPGYSGPDQFIYEVCNDALPEACDQATVYLLVIPVNEPPTAVVDYAYTAEGDPVSGSVTANDSDPDGNLNPNAYTLFAGPANGSLVFNSDGSYTYTPDANFSGTDAFIYQACDLGTPVYCDTAIVYIKVSNCPEPVSQANDPGLCTAVVNGIDPGTFPGTVSYALSGASTGTGTGSASGLTFSKGITTVTYSFNDGLGNLTSCSFTVTIYDPEPPTLECPANITLGNTPGLCSGQAVNAQPVLYDNCGGTPYLAYHVTGASNFNGVGNVNGLAFPLGTSTVTYIASDASARTSSCSFTLTVIDNQGPSFTCPSAKVVPAEPASCSAVVNNLGLSSINDNCGGPYTLTWSLSGATSGTGTGNVSGTVFNKDLTTVTYYVKDAANNVSSCSFTVWVYDGQPPALACPSDKLVNTLPGKCYTTLTGLDANLSDNCPGTPTLIYSLSGTTTGTGAGNVPTGTQFQKGNTTVTYTAIDASGNYATCSFLVTVIDQEAPVINCGSTLIVPTTPNTCAASPVLSTPTASDNCGTANLSFTSNAPSSFPLGTTIVLWKATDGSGNTATCQQIVQVVDNQLPAISCPADVSANTEPGLCLASVNLGVPAVNDNCGVGSVVNNAPYFFAAGVTTVTWTVTDNAGNSATCTQRVTVVDNQPPTLICPPAKTFFTDPGTCSVNNPQLGSLSVLENCPGFTVNNNAPSAFPLGNTVVTWTVTAANGSTASCNQLVTVVDNQTPSLSCPSAKTFYTPSGSCSVSGANLGAATAADNCTPSGSIIITNNAPASFPIGTTTVTWTAKDNSLNTATCTQLVTVVDNQPPTIACPAARTFNTNPGQCSASGVNLGTPVTSDNCSVASVSSNAPSSFPLGTSTVTWTVKDNANNSATCTQSVTVVDAQLPTISCPQPLTVNAIQGSCFASPAIGTPVTADNCSVASVTSDAPVSGLYPVGTTTVTWTVKDNANNSATCQQLVTVTDNQPPSLTCPAAIITEAEQGSCHASVELGTPVTSDNCGITSVTSNAPANGQFPVGTTTVTWTITDNSGNSATCTQPVTVLDNQAPSITCPADVSANTDPGHCYASNVNPGIPDVSDNCGIAGVVSNAPSQFNKGTTLVIWTVTDLHGNTASCLQTVTVTDAEAPAIEAPVSLAINTDPGSCAANNVNLGTPVTSDNCAIQSVSNNAPAVFLPGTSTVTWTVIDESGNSSTATQTVTVTDNQPPSILCPPPVFINADAGDCSAEAATVDLGMPQTYDNCGLQSLVNNAPLTYNTGQTTVVWTVTDNSGNTASCGQTVTVAEMEAPVITCPPDVTVNSDPGECGTAAGNIDLGQALATDNCGTVTVSSNIPAVFPAGTTTVTWVATDGFGNTSACEQLVTVVDNDPPEVVCPENIVINQNTSTLVSVPQAVVSDNCGIASVVNSFNGTDDASGIYPLGTTWVTWMVTDLNGNVASCIFSVSIICPPQAYNDTLALPSSTPSVLAILLNDSLCSYPFDYSTLTVITQPQHGTTAVDTLSGEITYSPTPGFTGIDSLYYEICDQGIPPQCTYAWAFFHVSVPPSATICGNATVCLGGTAVMLVNVYGQGPFTVRVSDGNNITTYSGITTPVYPILLYPTVSATYTITEIIDGNGVSGIGTGSAIIDVISIPAYFVTGGGNYCQGEQGVIIGLSGSTPGASYQLIMNGTGIGLPLAGTGAPLSFGLVTTPGYYTVVASQGPCTKTMYGTAVVGLWPSPAVFTVIGGGECCLGCADIFVKLSGSQTGVKYYLYRDGANTGTSKWGNGGPLNFGFITQSGTYTVVGVNSYGCQSLMSSMAVVNIWPQPVATLQTNDTTLCQGQYYLLAIDISSGSPPYTISVSHGNTTTEYDSIWCSPFVIPIIADTTTTYTLNWVTDGHNCFSYGNGSVTLSVIPCTPNPVVNLSGKVTYNNAAHTPITNTQVWLKQGSLIAALAITDMNGNYQFTNVAPGSYTLMANTGKPWGGGNATDALMIMQHFTQIYTLSGLPLQAANLSGDAAINAVDALWVAKRFVGLVNTFPSGDWASETPAVVIGSTPVTANFMLECYGDVNGSYNPPSALNHPTMQLDTRGVKYIQGFDHFELPVYPDQTLTIGALSLVLNIPSGLLEVEEVVVPGDERSNLVYNVIGDELRVSWYNTEGIGLSPNEPLLLIRLRGLDPEKLRKDYPEISLGGISEAADTWSDVKPLGLIVPRLSLLSEDLNLSVQPNPFRDLTEFRLWMPEDGEISLRIFDALGNELSCLADHLKATAGAHNYPFDGGTLPQGVYHYRMIVSHSGTEVLKTGKLVISR